MTVFEFEDYKIFLRKRITQMPKNGRGELQRISKHLRMHSTRFSHVFHGDEHLTLEQGIGISSYFGLSELESEYFMVLLQWAKAGNEPLRIFFLKRKKQLKDRASQLSERLPSDRVLSESDKAIFYSNWFYSAIRLACSLPDKQTIDTLHDRFLIPRDKIAEAIDFLKSTGLCVLSAEGKLKTGPKSTHLEGKSPLVSRLHSNWRIKAMERHPSLSNEELAFTSPMSIEEKDAHAIREVLIQMIEKACVYADTRRADTLYCLNLDWFKF